MNNLLKNIGIWLVIGLVVALMRQSNVPPARILGTVYVEIFRALPALLTILIVGFGLPIAFGAENLPGFLAALADKISGKLRKEARLLLEKK